jgi:hypothetical protein
MVVTEMKFDRDFFVVTCPICHMQTPVSVYNCSKDNSVYDIETAPLEIITEVHTMSEKGCLQCIHCNTHLYLQVSFAALTIPFSDKSMIKIRCK